MATDNTKLSAVFGHDTEAGRMLARLYGRPKVNEPVPKPTKLRPMQGTQPTMIGLNSKPEAIDPRSQTLNRAAMAIIDATKPPIVVTKEIHIAPIDTIKGIIRNKDQIDDFVQKNASKDIVVPPIKKGFNNPEAEKRRVQALFTFKGGRALPEAGLPEVVQGTIPLHMITGKVPVSTKRSLYQTSSTLRGLTSPLLEDLEKTFETVKGGLDDSIAFINEMRTLRQATKEMESDHQRQITIKTRELEKLDNDIKKEKQRLEQQQQRTNNNSNSSSSSSVHTNYQDNHGYNGGSNSSPDNNFDGWATGTNNHGHHHNTGITGKNSSTGTLYSSHNIGNNGSNSRSLSPTRYHSSVSSSNSPDYSSSSSTTTTGNIHTLLSNPNDTIHVAKVSISPRKNNNGNNTTGIIANNTTTAARLGF